MAENNFREWAERFISFAKNKKYSRKSVEIISTIVCSEQARKKGMDSIQGMKLALEYCKKYDDERECINKLLETIN